jgi:hypothetical protein
MTKSVQNTALLSAMILSTIFFLGLNANAVEIDMDSDSGTIESIQDPGVGHETHQLAIILPPSDNVYSGILSYNASEPIQLVALHGPLDEGEENGQAIWTPDGDTIFALTFVDPETSTGTWSFSGNALAVHTLNSDPFTVNYTVEYQELEMSDNVSTGTITSIQDPGVGHEAHQLAIIIAPSEKTYDGILTYSASEPIQLVSLKGPLGPGETAPAIWTPDGKTKFALTLVDPDTSMGSWEFSGNALAVHTMNTDQFTVSYSVSAKESEAHMMEDEMMEDEMMMGEMMSPLKQMKSGIETEDVVCDGGLILMEKSSDGSAACVKKSSSAKLVARGWGTIV